MGELGNLLRQTRLARGLTLPDIERDTRVSRKYLEALEMEEFDVFPAPVYARAFLKTYAQYLGLDNNEILRLFPRQILREELKPLPEMDTPPPAAFPINWVLAGVVVLLLLAVGLVFYRPGGGSDPLGRSTPAAGTPSAPANAGSAATVRTVGQIKQGEVPDLQSVPVNSAVQALNDAALTYVVVQVKDQGVPDGLVINQSPPPGTKTKDDTTVTLTVSKSQ